MQHDIFFLHCGLEQRVADFPSFTAQDSKNLGSDKGLVPKGSFQDTV